MPEIIKGFTHTEYLIVFIAIVFGYVGAEYFEGWGALVKNRKNIKSYWQHLLWTNFAFLTFIQNWWGIWPRTEFVTNSIYYFLFALVPIFIFYLVSVILFPDFSSGDKDTKDMKIYFYNNTRWFFGLLAIYFVFTIVSSFVYPDKGNVVTQNLIRFGGVLFAATAAYFKDSKILHIFLLVIGYVSLILFFIALPG